MVLKGKCKLKCGMLQGSSPVFVVRSRREKGLRRGIVGSHGDFPLRGITPAELCLFSHRRTGQRGLESRVQQLCQCAAQVQDCCNASLLIIQWATLWARVLCAICSRPTLSQFRHTFADFFFVNDGLYFMWHDEMPRSEKHKAYLQS